MRIGRLFHSFVLAMTLAVGSARADMPPLLVPTTTPVTPGAFYLSLGGLGAVHRSKGFEYGTLQNVFDFNDRRAMFSFGQSVAVGGGTATLGYALDKTDPLGGIGAAPRFEFAFTLFQGSQRDGSSPGGCDVAAMQCDRGTLGRVGGLSETGFGFLVVPPPFVPVGAPDGAFTVNGQYKGKYWGGDATFRYKTDFHVSRTLVLTPSVGVLGGAQVFKHDLRITYDMIGGPERFAAEVQASLSSFSVGPELGGALTWQATPRLSLHGGATIAFLYRHASLKSSDCGTVAGSSCPLVAIPEFSSSVDSSRSRMAFRVGMEVGATFKARPWLHVTVTGFGSYDTAVPGIARNDTYLTSGGIATSGPSKVVFSGEWSYGGALLFTIPFR